MSAKDAVAWLRRQIEDDKAAAEAAPGDHWQSFTENDIAGASVYDEQWVLLYPQRYEHDKPMSDRPGATGPQYIQRSRDELVAHIARNDPQHVIADCEAKLRILNKHRLAHKNDPDDDYSVGGYGSDGDSGCITCHYLSQMHIKGYGVCLTVRILATAYCHREGYAEHWKPVSV
jgi:Family of unknown function (DUF6221)